MAIQNPYIDPESGVFKNKLGVNDADKLHKKEYIATSNRARELREKPIEGNYDLKHLSAIHKHLLKDVYGWAGEHRTLNFSKRDSFEKDWSTKFAPVSELKSLSDEIAKDLKDKNYLKGLPKDQFVKELTSTYTKVNYLHPFPEGNGRATQELMSQLAKDAGYEINYKGVGKIIWNHAAARSQNQINKETGEKRIGDSELMQKVFNEIVSPIQKEKTHSVQSRTMQKDSNKNISDHDR